ncbi:receptor kinase-like protein Xa21 [Cornus florida]|uniref:receptor kinase-like protein Xa21 n=1 Tax=Cornus florida TaxID=4283 RepID=UPI00289C201D|nr:receptor kinase-like protein Xa21 [Cornus florida]
MEKTRFLFSIAVLVVHYHMTCTAKTLINITTDQSALFALKANIKSDPHDILAKNWSAATSVCDWAGVKCGARHQRVRALNISNMALQGTIPPHLGNLSFLVSLDISGNRFSGHLPNELVNLRQLKLMNLKSNNLNGGLPSWLIALSQLEHLLLANNCFTGFIPPKIFNISSLQSIDFSLNGVSGNLPVDMCNHLPELKRLNLSFGELNGQIPPTIYKCSGLQILSLAYNRFTGPIPREIGNLTMLKELYLGANYLEGNLPTDMCYCLPVLEVLQARNNKLMGIIPRGIGNCTSLKEVRLAENYFTGSIPDEIGNLNLEYFSIYANMLRGLIPATVFNMSAMKYLYLAVNQFSGQIPSSMGLCLPNLEKLLIGGNEFFGAIPSSISNASKLTFLDMSDNLLTGSIPNTLGNLRFLQRFVIGENELTGESSTHELTFISSFTNCRDLEVLGLSLNPLNGILPSSIGNLSASLQRFAAFDCKIQGKIPSGIGNLSNLIALRLESNEISGSIPPTVGRLQHLQRLNLSHNKLSGFIPTDLCLLRNLCDLILSGNILSGSVPTCLGELNSLRNLYIDSNNLTSTIPSTLWTLDDILVLNLSSNSLSGYLSSDIQNLKVVTQVDLSKNQLSGSIPSTIESAQSLAFLSLAHNRFQGPIPQSFGKLISLEFLDLSNNNLSSTIPKSLENLLYLKYLNLSSNRLKGEIPSGGPFANFLAQSFFMNDALCGASRLEVPQCKGSTTEPSRRTIVLLLKYIFSIIGSIILLLVLLFVLLRCRKQNMQLPTQMDLSLVAWRRISYEQLLKATNEFNESNLLGVGSFGSVYKGTLSDGFNVAIKVFKSRSDGALKSFDAECEVLRNVHHRNIVKIISTCTNTDFMGLILEYMPNGNLEKWLYSHNLCLDILQRLNIMINIASALEYLHDSYMIPIIHCDLKPSNVLLDEDMIARVGDFGISKLLGEAEFVAQTKTLATIGYMAPEYGTQGLVSAKCDVYSYGIMLMETFTRKKPTDEMFDGEMNLKRWVGDSLIHGSITEVVDSNLLGEDEHDTEKEQCVSSILALAVDCSADLPWERISMKDVVVRLGKIKSKLLQY